MIAQILSRLFGSKNEREIRRLGRIVHTINALEEEISACTDSQLQERALALAAEVAEGRSLDDVLPQSFALTREAARRTLGLRHYDVQLMGGIALHEGRIAEMRTGEGKTLVATLPLVLNALAGEGVHLVTVNDYLARRDAEWMSPVYRALGLSVGVALPGQSPDEKRVAYQCDITYGTNNEFGFDYLRDNMAFSLADRVQRKLFFAIVDEVDSILIDEARTPLIISGGAENTSDLYLAVNRMVPKLQKADPQPLDSDEAPEGDFTVDEKQRDVELTEKGHGKIESLLTKNGLLPEGESLYGTGNLNLLHHVHAALKAHALFQRDVDYMVVDSEILIVDEHTGRTLPGRRWSGGTHQAIEAKEGVRITQESQTLASTTFQNFFRLYGKLAGMTGTADTEAFEFRQIYGLDVVVVPTNAEMIRQDLDDLVFLTQEEKYEAIIEEVGRARTEGLPVLVGTASIESSELVSGALKKAKVPHEVLNAKFHDREAEIIAEAGVPGRVTIATNMAGRGTDIVLGGNLEAELAALKGASAEEEEKVREAWQKRHDAVVEAGGLYVIGTERHESRRIDNQLRGRSGRQGDPGRSQFFLSLEDNLMRIFANDTIRRVMQQLGMQRGEAIEHRMLTNAIERAQRKVEARNFDIRKNLLEYDDVANDQRQMIYQQRNELITGEDVSETITAIQEDVVNQVIDSFIPPQSIEEQWDIPGLEKAVLDDFNLRAPIQEWLDEDTDLHEETLRARILQQVADAYAERGRQVGPQIRQFEKQIMLQILDNLWKEHLASMDYLRQGIHFRAYAQKQPKQEYKREAFQLFEQLLANVKLEAIRFLSRVEFRSAEEEQAAVAERRRREAEARSRLQLSGSGDGSDATPGRDQAEARPFVRGERKIGRNEPCPCGSGNKYKNCHGKLA